MRLCRTSLSLFKATSEWLPGGHVRRLSIHEYQAHKLLHEFGIAVPRAKLVRTPAEASAAVVELGPSVIKAQVLGGGRTGGVFDSGLRSGVHSVMEPEQAATLAAKMLGKRLRTQNSPQEGHMVKMLYVAEKIQFDEAWYLAMTIDREDYAPVVVLSKRRGKDINAITRDQAEGIYAFNFRLSEGISDGMISTVSSQMNFSTVEMNNIATLLRAMFAIFSQKEATLLEVNPLARSPDGSFICLDANFTFDDSAAYRQRDLFSLRDRTQEVVEELEAEKHGLCYIKLEGNIGNVVNGAGLAMATNDAIGNQGGSNSNFLDAGGKATKETMQQAFTIITRDPRVKAILVNIYGGLTRCDMIAESIIGASRELDIRVPIVVRLQGTNSKQGLKILQDANLGLHVLSDFRLAARRVVELANRDGK